VVTENETEQTTINTFREMNRYDGHDEEYPSDVVFKHPRRTLANYWEKFHAARDCGARNVAYVEKTSPRPVGEKYEYELRCWSCQHRVPEDEVLFIGGDWFSQHGWKHYGRPLDDLWLHEDRVLDLGPNPARDELIHALELTRIEREGKGTMGFSFGNETWYECEDCGNETVLTFDERCRMCYDGEWTNRMQESVVSLTTAVRERNNSFVHRLPKQLSPTNPGSSPLRGKMLWRRHDAEGTTKLVEVVQRLQDEDDGHMEYVLADPTHTSQWQYHAEDLEDCFWDTGLYNDDHLKPVQDDRIREVYQQVCDHSFSTVHDPDSLDPTAEKCLKCRKRKTEK
jgi:hypothetical protein